MTSINTRIDNIIFFLNNYDDTATVNEWLEGLRTQYNAEATEWEEQCQAMANKMNTLGDFVSKRDAEIDNLRLELSNTKVRLETAQSEANLHHQLEDFLSDWCRNNDCEPEDTQSLAMDIIDNHLEDLFAELAEKNKKAWGKKVKWSVEVKVTYTGTIEVEALDEDDAREKAEEMCADGEIDTDDLNYYEMEVEDVNED